MTTEEVLRQAVAHVAARGGPKNPDVIAALKAIEQNMKPKRHLHIVAHAARQEAQ